MLLRRVIGNSMLPGLRPGAIVMARQRTARVGDTVIARQGRREVIKRLVEIHGGRYTIVGDNREESTDSREFGPVKKEDILGVVMITLPVAVDPPTVRTSYAALAGWIAAGVLIVSALIHLFRIDTLLPLLDQILPGGYTLAAFLGAVVTIAEVFAIPFVLRMKLSPLMQLMSGFFVIFAPLFWLLVAIWGFGYAESTAQFGEFMNTPSTIPLLMLNIGWLGFNFWALWLLGYDRVAVSLRKTK